MRFKQWLKLQEHPHSIADNVLRVMANLLNCKVKLGAVDIGLENLTRTDAGGPSISQNEYQSLRKAYEGKEGRGIIIPDSEPKLKIWLVDWEIALVPVDGSEQMTLPKYWRKAVLTRSMPDYEPEWIGKMVRDDQVLELGKLPPSQDLYNDVGEGWQKRHDHDLLAGANPKT